ncbi:hypothetical protein QO003_003759 [Arthrobacter silviterrae]|uniref:Uncharacterized protein n=1 Tax=Arthrobacter silviterrae TaxID=2026658 RepID=A0ABX0D5A2_9MICC|nr:hypothetical protein [Arthrobacter silviterrae]MDQ0279456.1 hypothetical protein [Arthrobacter silviterrae]NGN82064.1 hypothetical protein [Arthrobacter silviterrae]
MLRLSLDRGDLWDERTHGEQEWWKEHPWNGAGDDPDPWGKFYRGLTPTKPPAGRLELRLEPGQRLKEFELDLATAQGTATTTAGQASMQLPDAGIQRNFRFNRYLCGAGSRKGAPAQADPGSADGGLPPWKGDCHNGLNAAEVVGMPGVGGF